MVSVRQHIDSQTTYIWSTWSVRKHIDMVSVRQYIYIYIYIYIYMVSVRNT